MKKVIVPIVGAILVGLLVGVGGAWIVAPPVPLPEEHAATEPEADGDEGDDSAAALAVTDSAAAAAADVVAAGEPAAGTTTVMASPPAITRDTPKSEAPGVAAGVAEAVRVPQTSTEAVTPSDSARRLAKVFAAMRPADAAAVLQELSDVEARDVLLAMTDRAAGAILTHFEPSRAATISRVVLRRGT